MTTAFEPNLSPSLHQTCLNLSPGFSTKALQSLCMRRLDCFVLYSIIRESCSLGLLNIPEHDLWGLQTVN